MDTILISSSLELVRDFILAYMLQALHKDKALNLLNEWFELGRNKDYETWMGRKHQIYNLLRFDKIAPDLQVTRPDASQWGFY